MMPRGEKRQCLVVQNSLNEVIKQHWKMIFSPWWHTTGNSKGVHQRKDFIIKLSFNPNSVLIHSLKSVVTIGMSHGISWVEEKRKCLKDYVLKKKSYIDACSFWCLEKLHGVHCFFSEIWDDIRYLALQTGMA